MTTQCYFAPELFDGESFRKDVYFSVNNGRIEHANESQVTDALTLSGLVVPGFIDVQVNGGGGAFFNAEQSTECLEKIVSAHGKFGSTG